MLRRARVQGPYNSGKSLALLRSVACCSGVALHNRIAGQIRSARCHGGRLRGLRLVTQASALGLAAWAVAVSLPARAQDQSAAALQAPRLGTVAFQISCKPEVQTDFDRGVSFLHSFWYEAAADMFARVVASDPNCAMGYW